MMKRMARFALLPALLVITATLGGCIVAPNPYYPGYGYGYYGRPHYGWR